jgi:hypothetical protein
MKKSLLIVICLLSIVTVYGEEWINNSYPENTLTPNDITVSFNFPYNLSEIDVQDMIIEIEAYDVDGRPCDLLVKIKNSSGNFETLGVIPKYYSYGEFIIDNPTNYVHIFNDTFNNTHRQIFIKFNEDIWKNVTVIFHHINGSVERISKVRYWYNFYFDFPWSPENTTRIEIMIEKLNGGDKVFVDGNYVGNLIPGDRTTTLTRFTIDKENATNILSDKTITIKVEKSKGSHPDWIKVSRVTVKVHYTVAGGEVIKTPIPLLAVVLTLITIPIIVLTKL